VVEDDSTNRTVAVALLRQLGYEQIFTAVDGREAIGKWQEVQPDLVLMDCQMPEMDGYESTEAIRKQEQSLEQPCPWNPPVYVIALTAHAMQGDREKCLAAGMNDYLSKPVRPSELQAALERSKLAVQNKIDRTAS
jgi:CheY-like chemotaxis protein